jgi:hypothetical protein
MQCGNCQLLFKYGPQRDSLILTVKYSQMEKFNSYVQPAVLLTVPT